MPKTGAATGPHFIEQIVERDLAAGTVKRIVTRFPPEPNGFLHIGHAKSICLNFGLARDYDGVCHLRFDDTNPETEDMAYVRAAKEDIRWLGFDWDDHEYYASDYFEQLYDFGEKLIRDGRAFVDSQTEAQIRETRGTVTEPGSNSPFRDRTVDENLTLFRQMRAGDFPDGAHVLRARIDMASPNMLMRDPVLYRIKHAAHYRRESAWCIYPLYDFAHPLSDALEHISHSVCTLEFEVHRPLYDWLVDAVFSPPRPYQYEFARLNLDYTVVSKRKLLRLVQGGHVSAWDDPRMPTLAGLRRRGVTPEAIRRFCDLIGVAKADNRVDIALLEYAIRDDLNHRAPRVMAVLDPLPVTITNWPEDRIEWLDASLWPHDVPREGARPMPFGRHLYIDRDDFMEDPPKRYHRLSPGAEVRLRHGYIVRCDEVVKDADGRISEVRCTYDPETRSGTGPSRRVKGTIHWVEATSAHPVEVRLYDRLFRVPNPDDVPEDGDFLDHLNPESLDIRQAFVEHAFGEPKIGERFQFERLGYFVVDADSRPKHPVFNRTITLRDTWAKISETAPAPKKHAPRASSDGESDAGPPIPELTDAQEVVAAELVDAFSLDAHDAAVLASDDELVGFFRETARDADPRQAANWVLQDVQRERKTGRELRLTPAHLAALIGLVDDGTISSRTAKDVFADVVASGKDPAEVVRARGLSQIGDADELRTTAKEVVAGFPERAAAYRSGKKGLMGFFIGRVMAATGGRANPQLTREILDELLSE